MRLIQGKFSFFSLSSSQQAFSLFFSPAAKVKKKKTADYLHSPFSISYGNCRLILKWTFFVMTATEPLKLSLMSSPFKQKMF